MRPEVAFLPRGPARWAIVAFLIAVAYAAYLQPDQESYRDDQREYLALAHGLAARAEYTRATPDEPFIPESLRTPGYPMVLAAMCRTVGCGYWQVALMQAAMLAALTIVVAFLAGRIDRRLATYSAAATALYLPFAYFAAIPLAEVPATLFLALAAAGLLIALERTSLAWGAACGSLLAWAGLARPPFLAVPVAVAAALLVSGPAVLRSAVRPGLAAALAFAATLLPVVAYTAIAFGTPATSSSGTGLWWGYFQGRTATAQAVASVNAAAASGDEVEIVAAGESAGLDRVEAVEAAAVKRAIAHYDAVTDRVAQPSAWIELNHELASRAVVLIRHDVLGWIVRGLSVRELVLWTRELPIRVRDAMAAPIEVQAAAMAIQLALVVLAAVGCVSLIASGRRDPATVVPLMILAYTAVASFPFVTEPQYSLPAKPFLLIAAVVGARRMLDTRRRATDRRTAAAGRSTT